MATKKIEIGTMTRTDQGNQAAREAFEDTGRARATEKQQIGIRIPMDLYRDLETLRAKAYAERSGWTVNKQVNEMLEEFVKQHRTEIDEFRARNE